MDKKIHVVIINDKDKRPAQMARSQTSAMYFYTFVKMDLIRRKLQGTEWYLLSPTKKYGLIRPSELLSPLDNLMVEDQEYSMEKWAKEAAKDIDKRLDVSSTVLLGDMEYQAAILEHLEGDPAARFDGFLQTYYLLNYL